MKIIFTFFTFLFLISCEFEDQWKSSVMSGHITDSKNTINYNIDVNLDREVIKFKESKKEFKFVMTEELKNSIYGQVKNISEFPIPSYFQIKKETLTRYRIQFFHDKPNPTMIFGDLFISF